MKAHRIHLAWLTACSMLAACGGESPAPDGAATEHEAVGAASGYFACSWARPAAQASWIRDRILARGDFATLGCPITPELTVPGQSDGRYTYQRFAGDQCIAWDWSSPPVWTSPGNFVEMPCSQVRGLASAPPANGYAGCQWATPAGHASWIRDRYLGQGDFAHLGCPLAPEAILPGQSDGRYTYQPFEGNQCIAWSWKQASVWTSPGNFVEMPCDQVSGLVATPPAGMGPPPPPPPPPPPAHGSAGCGTAPGIGDLMPRSVGGRAYWLHAPAGVSSASPQKLVFVWHNCGGSVSYIRQVLDLEASATAAGDPAIFVYPSLQSAGGASPATGEGCFAGPPDLAYFDQVLADVESAYCVDTSKVFATGYSSGGIMSDLLGCARGGVVRGIAPVEGGITPGDVASCTGKVDAFVIHNPNDEVVGWDGGNNPYWGYRALAQLYANDGCVAPALSPADIAIGTTSFTCNATPDGVHPYRVSRWLHDRVYNNSNHTVPYPDAAGRIWSFFAATP